MDSSAYIMVNRKFVLFSRTAKGNICKSGDCIKNRSILKCIAILSYREAVKVIVLSQQFCYNKDAAGIKQLPLDAIKITESAGLFKY